MQDVNWNVKSFYSGMLHVIFLQYNINHQSLEEISNWNKMPFQPLLVFQIYKIVESVKTQFMKGWQSS